MTDKPYTDADVELVAEAIDGAPWPCEHSNPKSTDACDWWTCPQCQAAAVLDTVAPSLIAEGRRQAAEAIRNAGGAYPDVLRQCANLAEHGDVNDR